MPSGVPEIFQVRFQIQAADFPAFEPQGTNRNQIVFPPAVLFSTSKLLGDGNDIGLAAVIRKERAVLSVKRRQADVLSERKSLENSGSFAGVVKHQRRDAA